MVHRLNSLPGLLLIAVAFSISAEGQDQQAEFRHYEKEGLAFDYPATWAAAENLDPAAQFVELAPADKTAQLIVRWQTESQLDCEVKRDWSQLIRKLAAPVASRIHAKIPEATSWEKTQFGQLPIAQIHLHGQLDKVAVSAEICLAVARQRYLFLVYVRAENDQGGAEAWNLFQRTLAVAPDADASAEKESDDLILKGKLLYRAQPIYPTGVKSVAGGGDVVVQVLIDESGKVIKACALGARVLSGPAEDAAKNSKFTPTLRNGKPIRATATIVYQFPKPTPSAH